VSINQIIALWQDPVLAKSNMKVNDLTSWSYV